MVCIGGDSMAVITDDFYSEQPDIILQFNGTTTVSTEWIVIDWSGIPTDVSIRGYEIDFENTESTGNYTARVICSNMDSYTREKTVVTNWNSFWYSTKPTHYKFEVEGLTDTDSGSLVIKYLSLRFYYDYENRKPSIEVLSQDKNKISSINGYDRCTVAFRSDETLSQWEARATLSGITPAHGVGLLVEESSGTLDAGVKQNIYVDDEELTNGDAEYTISIFGLNQEGLWSDG